MDDDPNDVHKSQILHIFVGDCLIASILLVFATRITAGRITMIRPVSLSAATTAPSKYGSYCSPENCLIATADTIPLTSNEP